MHRVQAENYNTTKNKKNNPDKLSLESSVSSAAKPPQGTK